MGDRTRAEGASSINLCECGCGEPTPLARQTDPRSGSVKGEPLRFRRGHARRKPPIVRDCGYKTPCRLWQGWLDDGYGRVSSAGDRRKAHVAAWEAAHGPVPEGMELDHLCRQRACIEITHLEPVTRAENARRGSQTKLSPQQVREIRALRGVSQRDLARRFGVHQVTISNIQTRRSWKAAA